MSKKSCIIAVWLAILLMWQSVRGAPVDSRAAQDFDSFVASLPKDFVKGFVEVPLDWDNPAGPKVKVFYYGRVEGSFDGRTVSPVLFINGGPGFSSWDSYHKINQIPQMRNAPIIFIDQRGTGFSSAYPSMENKESRSYTKYYGSREIVRDIEYIRTRLLKKDTAWHVVGHSYGSLILYRYLIDYPDKIRSAHALSFALHDNPNRYLDFRLLGLRKAIEQYLAKYPKDLVIIEGLKDYLANGACDRAFIDLFISRIHNRESWKSLHLDLLDLMRNPKFVDLQFHKKVTVDSHQSSCALQPQQIIDYIEITGGDNMEDSLRRLSDKDNLILSILYNTQDRKSPVRADVAEILRPEFKRLSRRISIRDIKKANVTGKFKVYVGNSDYIVPVESFEKMRNEFGNLLDFHVIKGAGHFDIVSNLTAWQKIFGNDCEGILQ